MKMRTKSLAAIFSFLFAVLVLVPQDDCEAVSGINADEVKIIIDAKPSGAKKWINHIKEVETDEDGVVTLNGVLPGCYKLDIDEDDIQAGQYLGAKMKMLNYKGQTADNEDVDFYTEDEDGDETYQMTVGTDRKGWLKIGGDAVYMVPGTIYCLKMDKDSKNSPSEVGGRIPVKIDTKIKSKRGHDDDNRRGDYTEKFRALNKSTKTDQGKHFLNVHDLLPGKYWIRYDDDGSDQRMFYMRATMINARGEKAKKEKVKIYAYLPNGQKVLAGEIKTDSDGDLIIPTVPGKYKIDL